jgi:hypothetical protein
MPKTFIGPIEPAASGSSVPEASLLLTVSVAVPVLAGVPAEASDSVVVLEVADDAVVEGADSSTGGAVAPPVTSLQNLAAAGRTSSRDRITLECLGQETRKGDEYTYLVT